MPIAPSIAPPSYNALFSCPGGLLHNFQYGEVHANIWGSEILSKSIFGVCELQPGQSSIFRVHKSGKKEESLTLVRVSKLLDSIFGVPKTLGSIFGGQQGNSGIDCPVLKVREYPPGFSCCICKLYTRKALACGFHCTLVMKKFCAPCMFMSSKSLID